MNKMKVYNGAKKILASTVVALTITTAGFIIREMTVENPREQISIVVTVNGNETITKTVSNNPQSKSNLVLDSIGLGAVLLGGSFAAIGILVSDSKEEKEIKKKKILIDGKEHNIEGLYLITVSSKEKEDVKYICTKEKLGESSGLRYSGKFLTPYHDDEYGYRDVKTGKLIGATHPHIKYSDDTMNSYSGEELDSMTEMFNATVCVEEDLYRRINFDVLKSASPTIYENDVIGMASYNNKVR